MYVNTCMWFAGLVDLGRPVTTHPAQLPTHPPRPPGTRKDVRLKGLVDMGKVRTHPSTQPDDTMNDEQRALNYFRRDLTYYSPLNSYPVRVRTVVENRTGRVVRLPLR